MKTRLLILFGFFALQLSLAKVVETVPLLINVQPLTYCDPNNDGFGVFDLTQVTPLILAAQSGPASNYQITYQETFAANTISNPSAYYNINPWSQTIYYMIEEISSGDAAVGDFQIIVNPTPEAFAPNNYELCDVDANPFNGSTAFDLTVLIPQILGTMDPSAVSITFYTTLANADAGVGAITNIGSYVGTTETIFARATVNATGCYDVVSCNLIVRSPLALTTPTPLKVCDNDASPNDLTTTFDLTVKNFEINQGTGYSVTYYPSLAQAQSGSAGTEITNPTSYVNPIAAVQTLGVRVVTPQGCVSITTLDIRVLPIPTPLTNPPALAVCDINDDGIEQLDLTLNAAYMSGGDPTYTYHYFQTMADALSNTNEIATPTAAVVSADVWVRIQNNQVDSTFNNCYVLVRQPITFVNSVAPNAIQPNYPPYRLCNNSGVTGFETFNLASRVPSIRLGQPKVEVSFYPSLANAQNDTSVITNLNYTNQVQYVQTLGIRLTNICSGNYTISTMDIGVEPLPNIDLVSDDSLNAVYVDGSSNVVRPLTLDAQLSGNYSFVWEVNGVAIPSANASVYTVDTASPGGADRVFSVTATDLNTGCAASNSITVTQSLGTPSPIGATTQGFNPGDTFADLNVTGDSLQWYAVGVNKNNTVALSMPLPLNTLLVDGTTYYVSQTRNGIESISRLPVTVHAFLSLPDNGISSLQFAPNPVKGNLNLHSVVVLKSIVIYSMLGQKVFQQNCNGTDVNLDLSQLTTGTYILKAQGEQAQKVIRIVKE